jgi:hypothetical protein
MTNSLSFKKAFTFAVAAATILATAGLSAFVPLEASAASFGDLIKGETLSTVYYYGSDGQRYSFPNENTFFSWNADFDGVVEISDEDLADITLAGNIVYRPGSRWVKITSDEKVYAVSTDGSIRWVESEEVAEGLAGSDWNMNIDDVPDVFFVDYSVGDSLIDASEGYDGMLWTDGSDDYLVWDGEVRMVSSAGSSANGFQDGFFLTGTGFDVDSLTAGDDLDSASDALTDAAQMVETEVFAETEMVAVSLSSDSPASGTFIQGQAIANLAAYDFTNSSSSEVVVTGVTLNRTGVSADTTLTAVYLFDGWNRLSDSATVSDGVVSWNDAGGLFTIPAGETATVSVRSSIISTASGQTLGVSLDPDDVTFDGSYEATGSSIASAEHTIASATLATADFASGATGNPSAASQDAQNDLRVWEQNLTVGERELDLYLARFRNIGSADTDDVENYRLYVAGVSYGDAVANEDANGYVTFDLTADPLEMNTGTHAVKVLADVVGGTGRTVTVGMRNAADFIAVDTDYGQPVLATVGSSTFSAMDAGAQTINEGSLTITKEPTSPSGDVTDSASSVALASFELKAFGETIKVETIEAYVIFTDAVGGVATTDVTLRNGALFADGVQVGSTAGLLGSAAGATPTSYTLGSSLQIVPGSPVTLEVRADIYDSESTQNLASADTLQVAINAPTGTYAQRMSSGGYFAAPGTDVTGNTITIAVGTLTVAENTSYADQTVVDPRSSYKIGSFTIAAGTTEDVNLNTFALDIGELASATDVTAASDLSNLWIEYGPADDMTTSSTKGSVTENSNDWSVSYEIAAGETIYLNVYADLNSSLDAADTIEAELTVSGTTTDSSTSLAPSEVIAQTITIGAGSFSEFDGSHPTASIIAGNQEVTAANYRFSATNDDYTIKELTTDVTSGVSSAISEVHIYDGSDLVASTVYDEGTNTRATFTGLSIAVEANTSKTLTIKYTLNEIGTGAGASQVNVANNLYSVKVSDSQGSETTEADTNGADTTGTARFSSIGGNAMFVYKSIPTVAHVDLTNSSLVNGQSSDVYKFTVTASSQGDIALKQLKFPLTWTEVEGTDTLEMEEWKIYRNGTDVSSVGSDVLIVDEDGAAINDGSGVNETEDTVIVIWDTTEEIISAGETVTYTLRATPQGFDMDGDSGEEDYFTLYLSGDTGAHNGTDVCLENGTTGDIYELDGVVSSACTAAATSSTGYNFIWSDISGSSHNGGDSETGAADWANGYLILNLDLEGETWFK